MALCKMELSTPRLCLTSIGRVLPVLHLCHLMSDTYYSPNETVNSPITGMEMSIITQPKVATEEIAFGSQISGENQKMWHHSDLHKEDLNTDHIMYQSDSVVLEQRDAAIICRHFPPPC